ncbi:MAG: T9SS type A sorting domain-containing protein [candidate division FCPU426 bacterium]
MPDVKRIAAIAVSFSCLFSAWTPAAFSVPAVSQVSGTIGHGQTITVSGSGFGTKTPAAPLWWDDAEGAADGAIASRTAEIPHVVSFLSGSAKHYNDFWPIDLTGTDAADNMTYRSEGYKGTAGPHAHGSKYLVGCHNAAGECLGGEAAQTVALNVADISNKVPKDTWYVSYYYRMASDWPDYAVGNNYKEVNWETIGPNYHIYDDMGNYDAVGACSGGTGGLRRSPPCKEAWIAVDNINILATLEGGTYAGASGASLLTDASKNWPANYWVNAYLWNRTDGSRGLVTANDAQTATCALSGGTNNVWNAGDSYAFSPSGASLPGPLGASWNNCVDLQNQGGPVVTYDTGVKNPVFQWVHYERLQSYPASFYKKLSDNVVELDTTLRTGCHLDLYHGHAAAVTIGGYYGKDTCASCNGTIVRGITTANFNTVCVPLFDAWQASYDYAVGDKVRATTPNGYVYRVSADSGVSGGTEPAWPATGTVVDGQLTWTTEGVASYLQTGLDDRACRYFDDLYVDNTFSRVVLADNPDYDLATVIEPQIPSAWSDGSVTIRVNAGKLADNQQAYVFVFDAANQHNAAGFPVLLGASLAPADTPTPAVPAAGTARLLRVAPQPARETAVFHFAAAGQARVEISIFNSAGRLVSKVTGTVGEGATDLAWDARSVPPGIYLYRLVIQNQPAGTGKIAVQ